MFCQTCSFNITISECCCNDNFCEFCTHPGICNICYNIQSFNFSKYEFFISVYKNRGIQWVRKFSKILRLSSDETRYIYSFLLFYSIKNSRDILELLTEGADASISKEINGKLYTPLEWAIYKKEKDSSYILSAFIILKIVKNIF